MSPFRPAAATTSASASVTSTAAAAITAPASAPPTYQVRVVNAGTVVVFVKFGTAGMGAATSADTPVRGGETEIFTVNSDMTHQRVLAASNTATVYFTAGFGE